jgi:hypothetical protein
MKKAEGYEQQKAEIDTRQMSAQGWTFQKAESCRWRHKAECGRRRLKAEQEGCGRLKFSEGKMR